MRRSGFSTVCQAGGTVEVMNDQAGGRLKNVGRTAVTNFVVEYNCKTVVDQRCLLLHPVIPLRPIPTPLRTHPLSYPPSLATTTCTHWYAHPPSPPPASQTPSPLHNQNTAPPSHSSLPSTLPAHACHSLSASGEHRVLFSQIRRATWLLCRPTMSINQSISQPINQMEQRVYAIRYTRRSLNTQAERAEKAARLNIAG